MPSREYNTGIIKNKLFLPPIRITINTRSDLSIIASNPYRYKPRNRAPSPTILLNYSLISVFLIILYR